MNSNFWFLLPLQPQDVVFMLYIITRGKNHSTIQSFGAATTMETREARIVNEEWSNVFCHSCHLHMHWHQMKLSMFTGTNMIHDAQYLPALHSSVPHNPHLLASQHCLFFFDINSRLLAPLPEYSVLNVMFGSPRIRTSLVEVAITTLNISKNSWRSKCFLHFDSFRVCFFPLRYQLRFDRIRR